MFLLFLSVWNGHSLYNSYVFLLLPLLLTNCLIFNFIYIRVIPQLDSIVSWLWSLHGSINLFKIFLNTWSTCKPVMSAPIPTTFTECLFIIAFDLYIFYYLPFVSGALIKDEIVYLNASSTFVLFVSIFIIIYPRIWICFQQAWLLYLYTKLFYHARLSCIIMRLIGEKVTISREIPNSIQ